MDEPEEEKTPTRSRTGCRGCLLTGVALIAILIAVGIIDDWRRNELAEYSREQATRLQSGDLDGVWEGEWSWKTGQIARLIVRGNAVTLENFPVSVSDPPEKRPNIEVINSDRGKVDFPFFHGSSPLYKATYLYTGAGSEMLFLKCPSKGELGLLDDCDVVYGYEIKFRRVGPPRP